MTLSIEATESAVRPFCLIDKASGLYVRKADGAIMKFKTREAAMKFVEARRENI